MGDKIVVAPRAEPRPTSADGITASAPTDRPPVVIDWSPDVDEVAGSALLSRRMTSWLEPHYLRRRRLADITLFAVAAVGAWSVRFVQDDAFISFRYARNLAQGRGLVFNTGERVEGYTNFLWTVLMAVPEHFGWSTPLFSQVLGIALMLATLAVSLRLARNVLGNTTLAFLSAVVLVTNMTFLSYATGGLETMLQTLLVTSVASLLLPVDRAMRGAWTMRLFGAGLLGGLAVLTRLDSAVLLGTALAVHLWGVAKEDSSRRSLGVVRAAGTFGVAASAVVVPWFVWKVGYYGELVPNTFFAKSGGMALWPMLFGVLYLLTFFVGYFLFLLIGRWRRHRREFFELPGTRQAIWVVPVWLLYIVVLGGDFMEFRFMVPIMPVLAMVGAFLIDRYTSTIRQIALVAALMFASLGHIGLNSLGYPVHTFHDLRVWPSDSPRALGTIGTQLASDFPGGLDEPGQVTMAVGQLGTLPYFSELPTVDMLGLADAHVARHGEPSPVYYPGHLRMAPIDYLVARGVNLVMMVRVEHRADPERTAYRLSELLDVYSIVDLNELPRDSRVIEVPLDGDNVWVLLQLTPHRLVDAAVERNDWRVFPIERTCVRSDIPPLIQAMGSRTCPD